MNNRWVETVSAGARRVQGHDLPCTAGGGLRSRQCGGFGVRKEVRIMGTVAITSTMCGMPDAVLSTALTATSCDGNNYDPIYGCGD